MATVHAGDRVRYNRTTRDDYEGTVTIVSGTHFFVKYDEVLNPNETITPYPLATLDRTMENGRPVVEIIECQHAPSIHAPLTTDEQMKNPHFTAGLMSVTTDMIAQEITRMMTDPRGFYHTADGQWDQEKVTEFMLDTLARINTMRQKVREYTPSY